MIIDMITNEPVYQPYLQRIPSVIQGVPQPHVVLPRDQRGDIFAVVLPRTSILHRPHAQPRSHTLTAELKTPPIGVLAPWHQPCGQQYLRDMLSSDASSCTATSNMGIAGDRSVVPSAFIYRTSVQHSRKELAHAGAMGSSTVEWRSNVSVAEMDGVACVSCFR
jgi:hypothetical protein